MLEAFPPWRVQGSRDDGVLEAWSDVPPVIRHGLDSVGPVPRRSMSGHRPLQLPLPPPRHGG
eukprot:11809833-Alexandrium_andersonii.AAC.1